jgi:bacterioferritin-associated ferredoxin
MYVCLCHQLTDKQIREIYREAENADQVFELMGQSPICGHCLDHIESELRQQRDWGECKAAEK